MNDSILQMRKLSYNITNDMHVTLGQPMLGRAKRYKWYYLTHLQDAFNHQEKEALPPTTF